LNYFRVRALVPPGSYSKQKSGNPSTIATNKSGHGLK
jgi:hypothetical protein